MKKRLVLAGGGHAHMETLAQLRSFVDKGFEVTVIGPSEHHYYSGMGPGMLGAIYAPEEIRFATRHVCEKMGARFQLGTVVRIDPHMQEVKLDDGTSLPYDVLSCNLGSQVPEEIVSGPIEGVYLVKPIERLLEAKHRILSLAAAGRIRIGIVGGGPSAVEIGGNVWRLGQNRETQPPEIVVFASGGVLPDHPPGVRRRAIRSLLRRDIAIRENCRIAEIKSGRLVDESGTVHSFDLIFVAVGVRPSPVFKQSGIAVGPDGGMLVNRCLQSTEHPNIFGGGDCICFRDEPLDKVGVFAVRQNPILRHNLMAALEGGALRPFEPGGDYLLIFNLGDDTGIFYKWSLLFGGRPAFWLKDRIDRKFMRTYQALE